MASSSERRGVWVQLPEAQARLIASAALLTALNWRGGAGQSALQPLTRSFTRRLSQRNGQQLCYAHGRPAALPVAPTTATAAAPSGPGALPAAFPSRSPLLGLPRANGSCAASGRSSGGTSTSTSASPAGMPSRLGLSGPHHHHHSHQPLPFRSPPAATSTSGASASAASRPLPSSSSSAFAAARPFPRLPGGGGGGGSGSNGGILGASTSGSCGSSSAFRSFASAGLRLPAKPHLPRRSLSTSATATSTSASTASAARAHLHASLSRLYRATSSASSSSTSAAASLLLHTLAPYWGRTLSRHSGAAASLTSGWSAALRFLTLRTRQSAGALLPSLGLGAFPLGAFRQLHFFLLAALNVVGNNLPVTAALAVAELARSSRTSHADAFQIYVEETPGSGEEDSGSAYWWQELPLQMAALLDSLGRSLWLLLLFAPVLLSAPVALQLQFRRLEWIELLRKTLEAAGPAFIKWGQWAATRHDLFPPDMCSELEKLHTQAPGHKFRHTKAAIEAAFGVPLSELFSSIEHEPVASGSIGQIHRAVLSDRGAAMTGMAPGTTVAVKVRHPGVGAAILRDFATMMAVAHLASLMPSLRHLRLEQTLSQFAAPLREQVDLSREGNNLRLFNYNFRKTRHVFFPVPLYPLVTPDVLVETFETGEHITHYIQSENNPYNHRLSELGSGTMLQMMLVDNLIHSDLHPGNILVRLDPPGGMLGLIYKGIDHLRSLSSVTPATRARLELLQQRWLQPSLVLLDVGMATEMTPVDQTNMVGLFRSFAAMDGRACGDWTLRFSGEAQSCPDPEAFRTAMQEAFDELHKMDLAASGQVDSCTFRNGADALAAVLELVRVHQVSLPGHICAVVVTTLVLEGWSNKLDPDHSVLTQVQAMFEPENVPWSHRIPQVVDKVMEEEANHFALA